MPLKKMTRQEVEAFLTTLTTTTEDLTDVDLSGVDLSDLVFRYMKLTNVNLTNANLSRTLIDNCKFNGCSIQKANFKNSTVKNSLFRPIPGGGLNNISEANFESAEITDTVFQSATAIKTNFNKAQFDNARFAQGDYTNASFENSPSADISFDGSDLSGAKFTGTELGSSTFDAIKINDHTRWGSKLPAVLRIKEGAGPLPSELKQAIQDSNGGSSISYALQAFDWGPNSDEALWNKKNVQVRYDVLQKASDYHAERNTPPEVFLSGDAGTVGRSFWITRQFHRSTAEQRSHGLGLFLKSATKAELNSLDTYSVRPAFTDPELYGKLVERQLELVFEDPDDHSRIPNLFSPENPECQAKLIEAFQKLPDSATVDSGASRYILSRLDPAIISSLVDLNRPVVDSLVAAQDATQSTEVIHKLLSRAINDPKRFGGIVESFAINSLREVEALPQQLKDNALSHPHVVDLTLRLFLDENTSEEVLRKVWGNLPKNSDGNREERAQYIKSKVNWPADILTEALDNDNDTLEGTAKARILRHQNFPKDRLLAEFEKSHAVGGDERDLHVTALMDSPNIQQSDIDKLWQNGTLGVVDFETHNDSEKFSPFVISEYIKQTGKIPVWAPNISPEHGAVALATGNTKGLWSVLNRQDISFKKTIGSEAIVKALWNDNTVEGGKDLLLQKLLDDRLLSGPILDPQLCDEMANHAIDTHEKVSGWGTDFARKLPNIPAETLHKIWEKAKEDETKLRLDQHRTEDLPVTEGSLVEGVEGDSHWRPAAMARSVLIHPNIPAHLKAYFIENPTKGFFKNPSLNENDLDDMIQNVEKDTDLYRKSNLLTKAVDHPQVSVSTLLRLQSQPELDRAISRTIEKSLWGKAPDAIHTAKGLVPALVRFGTNKLRQLRDFIEEKGGAVHKKDMPNFPATLSRLLDGKGNLTAQNLQKEIDSFPVTKYNISHSEWDGVQRSNDEGSTNHVLQVNITNDMLEKLKAAGVYDTFQKLSELSRNSYHPVHKGTIGWVRWYGSNTPHGKDGYVNGVPGIHIDEVQSDFGQYPHRHARNEQERDAAQKQFPDAHMDKISEIVLGGKHASEMLQEVFHEWARSNGHVNTPVAIHAPEPRAKLSGMRTGDKLPGHILVGYKKVPEKMGLKPSTFGTLSPQTHEDFKGGATYEDKIRKMEDVFDGDDLSKNLGGLALSTLLTVSPQLKAAFDKVNPPPVEEKQPARWTPEGLHADLIPIAHLESSFGVNMNHLPNSKGDYHTAFGPVGFKPSTAHEEWKKSPKIKGLYPKLEDPADFMKTFKSDWKFYNLLASSHFLRLKHRHGSPEKAAYAWRWGTGACSGAHEDTINKDNYVMRYRDLSASSGLKKSEPIDVDHYSPHSDLKELHPKFQGTGMTGAEKQRPNRLPRTYFYFAGTVPEAVVATGAAHQYRGTLPANTRLYDMGKDHEGLLKPQWIDSDIGQVYDVPDLDDVERTLVQKGYHGYHNYGVEGALAYFKPLKVKRVGKYVIKKSEGLAKMAIKDLPPGKRITSVLPEWSGAFRYLENDPAPEAYNYNHLLPKKLRRDYSLVVSTSGVGLDRTVKARILHNQTKKQIGDVEAAITGLRTAEISMASVNQDHKNKGLGLHAYEAVYSHMYHHHGIRTVGGGDHSTLAARTHQKLATKHGWDYIHAHRAIGRGVPYDGKFGGYDYDLE